MRRRSFGMVLVSAIAVLGLSVAGTATALADDQDDQEATVTRASFDVCAQVDADRSHAEELPPEDCRATATTHAEGGQDESSTGTFCLDDNPIGVDVHFQELGTGDGREGGDFTVTLIGPSPAEETSETRDYAAFRTVTLGELEPGEYEVTVEYHGQDDVAQPAAASTTFEMTDECEEEPEPPAQGMPGWGYGDTNHDHVGPGAAIDCVGFGNPGQALTGFGAAGPNRVQTPPELAAGLGSSSVGDLLQAFCSTPAQLAP